MSTGSENELDLDKLFLPAWAQEPAASKYAKYEVEEERQDRREGHRSPRPQRRDRAGGPDRGRDQRGGPRGQGGERRGPRPEGSRGRPGDRPGRPEPRERREPPAPLPELTISFLPDEKGVDSLARQIKMTGRAYPLFDIAQMILQRPERHMVTFAIKKNAEGKSIQPLFVCALDDTLWLSEEEAVGHVLNKHFSTFYQAERTATEPPKGKYTFVAQCGISGVVLGPPNYHDYQNQIRKLHAERFSRMPFEVYKSRVKIVRDEEVVKKWVDDQSWKTDYVCLNMAEPLRLPNMEAVEKHFRETHKDTIIKQVESHSLNGAAARALRSPELTRLVRSVYEDQRRFPLQIATALSQQFASRGLQFFKVNKTITHVSVARPHYLDMEATPVSDGVRHIVEYINSKPRCSRRQLIETLAPSPAPTPKPIPVPTPASSSNEPAPADGAASATQASAEPHAKPELAPTQTHEPTAEQTAVISDLHWLVHQGHVIEFANGTLETAKKPVPKPPRPEPKKPEATIEPEQVAEHPVPAEVANAEVPQAEASEPTVPSETQATETAPPAEPNESGESNSAPEHSPTQDESQPSPGQDPVPSPS